MLLLIQVQAVILRTGEGAQVLCAQPRGKISKLGARHGTPGLCTSFPVDPTFSRF